MTRYHYENIVVIDASGSGKGYKTKNISNQEKNVREYLGEKKSVKEYLNEKRSNEDFQNISEYFFNSLCMEGYSKDSLFDALNNSMEGICLRSLISHLILQGCEKKFWRFSLRGQRFQLYELLAIVLSDDGRPLPSVGLPEHFIPYSFQILQEYLKEYMKRKEKGKPIMGLD